MKNDMRFRKTEAALKQSILALILRKPYSEITVTDICNEALCSRNAFYQHYETKEHLLESIIKEVIANIQKGFAPVIQSAAQVTPSISKQFMDNILSSVYQEKEVIQLLLKCNELAFFTRLKQAITEGGMHSMKQTSSRPIDDISRAYMVFVSSGIAGFIEYCLTDGQLSLEEAQKIGYEVTLATMMGGAKIISS